MEKALTLAGAIEREVQLRGWSPRTAESYTHWMRRYVRFHRRRHPRDMGEREVRAFLEYLAMRAGRDWMACRVSRRNSCMAAVSD